MDLDQSSLVLESTTISLFSIAKLLMDSSSSNMTRNTLSTEVMQLAPTSTWSRHSPPAAQNSVTSIHIGCMNNWLIPTRNIANSSQIACTAISSTMDCSLPKMPKPLSIPEPLSLTRQSLLNQPDGAMQKATHPTQKVIGKTPSTASMPSSMIETLTLSINYAVRTGTPTRPRPDLR